MTDERPIRELLPCPFCGSNVVGTTHETKAAMFGATAYYVECRKCDQKFGGYYNHNATIDAWNRRAPVEPPKEK